MRADISRPIEIRVAVAPNGTVGWIVTVTWTGDSLPDSLPSGTFMGRGTTISQAMSDLSAAVAAAAQAG